MGPVHDAARANDVAALQSLLDADPGLVDVDDGKWMRERPLHHASEAGSVGAARLLMDRGAGVDMGDKNQATALMIACYAGQVGK